MSDPRIPLSDLDYGAEEEAAALRVLRSKWLSMGAEVQAFEREFAEFVGTKHAIAVANATAALHLSYLALGLGPGYEVIQPAINFVAAANATVAAGADSVFADIVGLHEPTIDPVDVERRITPHTRAVVVMHYGGYLCRMDDITSICQRHGLTLIEDACHAVGAHYDGGHNPALNKRMAGNLGDIACFSFFSNKNLATGEGGMVTTNRDDLATRVRLLRSHGMTTMTWDRHRGHASSYDVVLHGYNYRLDELRAALGRVQLTKLRNNNEARARLTAAYREHLLQLPGWRVPFADSHASSSHHLMVIIAPNNSAREAAAATLRRSGVQTSLHYPSIPGFTAFAHSQTSGIDRSEDFASRALTLPLFPTMTLPQVEEVCSLLRASCSSPLSAGPA